MKKIIIVIMLSPLLGGCASMMSHGFVPVEYDPFNPKAKCIPVFPGTAADIGMTGVALASPFIPEKVKAPRWFIVATPFIIVDTPLSLVADILFLPRDLCDIDKWRESRTKKNSH